MQTQMMNYSLMKTTAVRLLVNTRGTKWIRRMEIVKIVTIQKTRPSAYDHQKKTFEYPA